MEGGEGSTDVEPYLGVEGERRRRLRGGGLIPWVGDGQRCFMDRSKSRNRGAKKAESGSPSNMISEVVFYKKVLVSALANTSRAMITKYSSIDSCRRDRPAQQASSKDNSHEYPAVPNHYTLFST